MFEVYTPIRTAKLVRRIVILFGHFLLRCCFADIPSPTQPSFSERQCIRLARVRQVADPLDPIFTRLRPFKAMPCAGRKARDQSYPLRSSHR